MGKTYETPKVYLDLIDERDVITTSDGDTPKTDVFDW